MTLTICYNLSLPLVQAKKVLWNKYNGGKYMNKITVPCPDNSPYTYQTIASSGTSKNIIISLKRINAYEKDEKNKRNLKKKAKFT